MHVAAEPLVSVIVPCRNESAHVDKCLESILGQESPPGGFEIIVADGMSDDGTRELLMRLAERDPRLRVIDNPGEIVSTGLNTAIKASKGDIIVRMDMHTEYAPDYIEQCVATLAEKAAENVGGPWVAKGNGYVSSAIAAAFQSPFSVGGARGHNPTYDGIVDTVYLGCWPRDVFARHGLFDEDLVRNQDDEFNLRLSRAGARIWQSPRIKSWYTPRNSMRALLAQYIQYGYWKVRVIQKHRLPASVRHIVPGGFVAALFFLFVLALIWPATGWILLGIVTAYAAALISAAFMTAGQNVRLLPILPIVFAAFHLGYGYGFLRGVIDFILLGQSGAPRFRTLTRTPRHLFRRRGAAEKLP